MGPLLGKGGGEAGRDSLGHRKFLGQLGDRALAMWDGTVWYPVSPSSAVGAGNWDGGGTGWYTLTSWGDGEMGMGKGKCKMGMGNGMEMENVKWEYKMGNGKCKWKWE